MINGSISNLESLQFSMKLDHFITYLNETPKVYEFFNRIQKLHQQIFAEEDFKILEGMSNFKRTVKKDIAYLLKTISNMTNATVAVHEKVQNWIRAIEIMQTPLNDNEWPSNVTGLVKACNNLF